MAAFLSREYLATFPEYDSNADNSENTLCSEHEPEIIETTRKVVSLLQYTPSTRLALIDLSNAARMTSILRKGYQNALVNAILSRENMFRLDQLQPPHAPGTVWQLTTAFADADAAYSRPVNPTEWINDVKEILKDWEGMEPARECFARVEELIEFIYRERIPDATMRTQTLLENLNRVAQEA